VPTWRSCGATRTKPPRFRSLRALLAGAVSASATGRSQLRILPRVLGATRRALAAAEDAASVALASVPTTRSTSRPTKRRPLGEVFSTGGYHNATATPAMDALAVPGRISASSPSATPTISSSTRDGAAAERREWTIKRCTCPELVGEEARSLAQPTLLSLGGFGQNDIAGLPFLAWRKAVAVGRCLDGALAALAGICSQALFTAGRPAGPPLEALVEDVRGVLEPVSAPATWGRTSAR